ncbi:Predicted pyrophosphatase or phosphodiesterase, AlkP superfamily [Nakamurella panacisegetis]|uniref:Predicted pyrophosphatase or phosphodiesterase, AlkP superfamily n=1 Tax=Nakamurella panacisegetis TaxID=1090615 RepID=A0A1H0PP70_9ACTN|nr:Predicted pyrophosphatase or phosphodiesterase, AlkP superfamily [Nakamurella panacisegetis]
MVPTYGPDCLGAVLPGVAAALGAPIALPAVPLPTAERVCVVLVDGLGHHLLHQNATDAPFLASMAGTVLRAGTPSTTATSVASFGTGRPPGQHGLVGYQVMDPDRGELLNELRWDPAVDPARWQPHPTVFEHLTAAGIGCTAIGNPEFDGSGLTQAALRGPQFVGVGGLHQRVDVAVRALAAPGLVYLYWGQIDAAGHQHGVTSRNWLRALREADEALARLARQLPSGTLLLITADHGMIDVPHEFRVDLATRPDLQPGIRVLAGEARFAQAYCEPGAAAEVARRLSDAFGELAWVRTRDEAIADHWFGPVDDRVVGRIGDVVVAGREPFVFVDSRTTAPHELKLIGQHGSLTDAEQLVPLLEYIA